MTLLHRTGVAGTEGKNDILVTIEPAEPGAKLSLELTSPVKYEFGNCIESLVGEMLKIYHIMDAKVVLNDKGAWDFTIRARVETAILRAMA
ncbi:citrate lyase acyl carrier protein [Candidatus Formimonas warabiya]|uniref:Citrate lyase acyl carrier protein n=1 Tax=Formimonas warabiya TaxID=1761012 RepID=A0A3G1KRB8_FORW1|nr:citrate lyase acyl carrier protein [Candidatus Formimonas warabiya]ATW24986.1 citrate lyase acyl carrier protein [Candidatus Formimonas warabiya]